MPKIIGSSAGGGGGVDIAGLPSVAKFQYIGAGAFEGYGGATFAFNTGGKKGEWLIDASGEGAVCMVVVPPGVSSVTAKLWMRGGDANITIFVRAVAIGNDFGTDTGTEDSLANFGDGTNNIQRVDVSTAFNASGVIAADKILHIRVERSGAGTVGLAGLELLWA